MSLSSLQNQQLSLPPLFLLSLLFWDAAPPLPLLCNLLVRGRLPTHQIQCTQTPFQGWSMSLCFSHLCCSHLSLLSFFVPCSSIDNNLDVPFQTPPSLFYLIQLHQNCDTFPVTFDSGDTITITPNHADFGPTSLQ